MLIPVSIVVPLKFKDNKVFVWGQVRHSQDSLNGLVEFPGGKIETDETPEICAHRETQEETGVVLDSNQIKEFKVYETDVDHKRVQIFVFIYNDLEQCFDQSGWHPIDLLAEESEKIPPINLTILREISMYFQDVTFKDD